MGSKHAYSSLLTKSQLKYELLLLHNAKPIQFIEERKIPPVPTTISQIMGSKLTNQTTETGYASKFQTPDLVFKLNADYITRRRSCSPTSYKNPDILNKKPVCNYSKCLPV